MSLLTWLVQDEANETSDLPRKVSIIIIILRNCLQLHNNILSTSLWC